MRAVRVYRPSGSAQPDEATLVAGGRSALVGRSAGGERREHAADLAKRHADPRVKIGRQCLHARSDLHTCGTAGVRGLVRMSALDAPSTPGAVAALASVPAHAGAAVIGRGAHVDDHDVTQ